MSVGQGSEVGRWQAPEPPARRISKKKVIVAAGVALATLCGAGAASVALFDVSRVHLGYDAAKAAYLEAGYPWTGKDVMTEPPVPDSKNAALGIKPICDQYSMDRKSALSAPLDDSNIGEYRAYLVQRKSLLDSVAAELRARPNFNFKRDWSLGSSLLFPEFAPLKSIVKDLCARSELKLRDGDKKGALADLSAAADLSVRAESDKVLISALVSCACRKTVSSSAARLASLDLNDSAFLQDLASTVKPMEAPIDFVRMMRSEAYVHVWTLRNMNALGGIPGLISPTRSVPAGQKPPPIVDSGDISGVIERSMAVRSFEFWADFAKEAKKRPNDPIYLSTYLDRQSQKAALEKQSSYGLLRILFPTFSEAGTALVKAQATVRATRANLLAWSERAKGKEVSSLKEVPGGPWTDPFTDSEFRTRFEKKKVLIWSVGRDLKDQGGGSFSDKPVQMGVTGPDDVGSAIPYQKEAGRASAP